MSLKRKSINDTINNSIGNNNQSYDSISNFKIRKEDFKLEFNDEFIMTPKKFLIQGYKQHQENRNITPKLLRTSSNNLLSEFNTNSTPLSPLNLDNINNINLSSSSSSLSLSPSFSLGNEKSLKLSSGSVGECSSGSFVTPATPINKFKQKELLNSLSQLQSPKTKPVNLKSSDSKLKSVSSPVTTSPTISSIMGTSKLKTPMKSLNTFSSPQVIKRQITPTNVIIPLSNMTVSSPQKTDLELAFDDDDEKLVVSPPKSNLRQLSPPKAKNVYSPPKQQQQPKNSQVVNKRIKDIKNETDPVRSNKADIHPSKIGNEKLSKLKSTVSASSNKMVPGSKLKNSSTFSTPVKSTPTPTKTLTTSLTPMKLTTPIKTTSKDITTTPVTSKFKSVSLEGSVKRTGTVASSTPMKLTTPIKTTAMASTSTTPSLKRQVEITKQKTSTTSMTPIIKKIKSTTTTTTSTTTTPITSKFKTVSLEGSVKRIGTSTPLAINKRDLTLSSSKKLTAKRKQSEPEDVDFEARIESALLAAAQGNSISTGSLLLSSPEREMLQQNRNKWSPIKRKTTQQLYEENYDKN